MIQPGVQVLSRVSSHLPKLGIILAVLVGPAVVLWTGRLPVGDIQAQPQALLAGAVSAVAVGLALIRIEYGVVFLPVVAAAVPLALGTGTESTLVASLLFAAFLLGLFAIRLVARPDLVLVGSPINLPLLGFVLAAVLATINSDVMRHPLVYVWPTFRQVQMGGLSVFIISAGILLVVMSSIRQMRWNRWLTWVFLATGAGTIVGYLLRSGRDLPGFSTGGLFSMWVIALALGQALFNHRMPGWGRAGLLLLVAAWLYRRFFLETGWLSGWVPALVAILTISFLRSRLLFLVVIAGIAIVGWPAYGDVYEAQVAGAESAGNFLRLDLWRQNLEVTRDHLLLGLGPAGYAPYYMTFFPDRALSSHSNYLDVFSQTGLIGSFFFVWFLLATFRVGIDARKQWPTGFAAGFANGVVGGLVGVVVAMALGDWLIPFVYNQSIAGFRHTIHTWLLLGALASLRRIEAE